MDGEVGVEVTVADRKRLGGLWASEWKWDGVAAPGLGTSRTEAACKAPSTDSPTQRQTSSENIMAGSQFSLTRHQKGERASEKMSMCHFGLGNGEAAPIVRPREKSMLPLIRPPCFHKFPWQGSAEVYCPHNPSTALLSNTLTLTYSKLQT